MNETVHLVQCFLTFLALHPMIIWSFGMPGSCAYSVCQRTWDWVCHSRRVPNMARHCPVTHWTSHIYHILSYFGWFRAYCDIAQDYSVRRQIGRNVAKKKMCMCGGHRHHYLLLGHITASGDYTPIYLACSCSQYRPHADADNPVHRVPHIAWTMLLIFIVNVAEFWLNRSGHGGDGRAGDWTHH